jgi:hypothetical protein
MLFFYGDKISPNRTKTEEGYLIITNCPIARTGEYEYLASELGIQGNNDIVKVFRPPEEVFSLPAIASFNGKSITDNHPPVLLDARNNGIYEKGTVINVRQGNGDESDLLLGDLIIKDPQLIEEIESGRKKEISCGYDCIYDEDEQGRLVQRQIRGNHVAIVENGRAGSKVAVKDNSTIKNSKMEGEKKKMKIPKQQRGPVTNFFAALGMKHFAKDAEPEEISEAIDALAEEREDKPEEKGAKMKVKDAETETPEEQAQENSEMLALSSKVEKCMELCQKCMEMMQGTKEKAPEEAIDEMIEELGGETDPDDDVETNTGDQEESVTIPVEELSTEDDNSDFTVEGEVSDPSSRPKNPIKNADTYAMIKALKAMKPVIAAIKDPKDRKKACDSLMTEFKKANKTTGRASKQNGYKGIIAAQRQTAQQRAAKTNDSQNKLENIQNMYNQEHDKYKNRGVK